MKPVEGYEAERAFKEFKTVFVVDMQTKELIHLNRCTNKNYILNVFMQPGNLFYIFNK